VPAWEEAIGAGNVLEVPAVMGGEDFSEYGRTEADIPIFILWLGTVDEERFAAAKAGGTPLPGLHSPLFWPAIHPTIETGVTALTASVLELLGK
jgi:hippurate hydrolase